MNYFRAMKNLRDLVKGYFCHSVSLKCLLFDKGEFRSYCLIDKSLKLFIQKIPATNKGVIQKRKKMLSGSFLGMSQKKPEFS